MPSPVSAVLADDLVEHVDADRTRDADEQPNGDGNGWWRPGMRFRVRGWSPADAAPRSCATAGPRPT